jgi:hypothetical protein
VRDGKPLLADAARVRAEAQAVAERLWSRARATAPR